MGRSLDDMARARCTHKRFRSDEACTDCRLFVRDARIESLQLRTIELQEVVRDALESTVDNLVAWQSLNVSPDAWMQMACAVSPRIEMMAVVLSKYLAGKSLDECELRHALGLLPFDTN